MFIKPLKNLVLNVFFLLKTFSNVKTFRFIFGSSGIWSDKVSLLHIKGTQRGGEHGGESIKTISRRCRRHKERQRRSVRVADSFGKKRFKKSCKPQLCNEVDKSINKTRKYPLMLHAPTVPLCLTISSI